MIQKFIRRDNCKILRIFFAGWGGDSNLFGRRAPKGVDFMLCYDYRDMGFDYSLLEGYEAVEVVAWSFGVWVASQTMGGVELSSATAICGTEYPIDDLRGIPEAIFEGTLRSFSPQGLVKFRRRMCGGSEGVREFLALEPFCTLEELRDELSELGLAVRSRGAKNLEWTRVVIASSDNIVPTGNQYYAWGEHKNVIVEESAHYSTEIFETYLYE